MGILFLLDAPCAAVTIHTRSTHVHTNPSSVPPVDPDAPILTRSTEQAHPVDTEHPHTNTYKHTKAYTPAEPLMKEPYQTSTPCNPAPTMWIIQHVCPCCVLVQGITCAYPLWEGAAAERARQQPTNQPTNPACTSKATTTETRPLRRHHTTVHINIDTSSDRPHLLCVQQAAHVLSPRQTDTRASTQDD